MVIAHGLLDINPVSAEFKGWNLSRIQVALFDRHLSNHDIHDKKQLPVARFGQGR